MFDYLDKLRAQPIHVRRQIAWVSTIALSSLVFGIWWAGWNSEDVTAPSSVAEETPAPWSVVFDSVGRMKEEMLATLQNANDQLKYAAEESVENATSTGIEMAIALPQEGEVPVISSAPSYPDYSDSPEKVDPNTACEVVEKAPEKTPPVQALHTRPKVLEDVVNSDKVQ